LLLLTSLLKREDVASDVLSKLFITKPNLKFMYDKAIEKFKEGEQTIFFQVDSYSLETYFFTSWDRKYYLLIIDLIKDFSTGYIEEHIGSYIKIFNKDGTMYQDIDDVWSFTYWV